jgi:hypothetical protein
MKSLRRNFFGEGRKVKGWEARRTVLHNRAVKLAAELLTAEGYNFTVSRSCQLDGYPPHLRTLPEDGEPGTRNKKTYKTEKNKDKLEGKTNNDPDIVVFNGFTENKTVKAFVELTGGTPKNLPMINLEYFNKVLEKKHLEYSWFLAKDLTKVKLDQLKEGKSRGDTFLVDKERSVTVVNFSYRMAPEREGYLLGRAQKKGPGDDRIVDLGWRISRKVERELFR